MTRGERNNNPLNIRHVPGVIWLGQAAEQTDDAFVQFTDPIYGIRAGARILHAYENQGIDTVGEAIDRWAPPNENNSAAYVTDVCQQCSVEPDAVMSLDSILPALIKAMIVHENGRNSYTDLQITQGIALA